jgi:hypothetical protein
MWNCVTGLVFPEMFKERCVFILLEVEDTFYLKVKKH